MRSFVAKLLGGAQNIKIGVVGGSITWGLGASKSKNRWFTVFSDWMASVTRGSNFTSRNGGMPATPSGYMLMCLEASVDADVDLVIVEYSLNDGVENVLVGNRIVKTMEQLIRRILDLPGRPAVVLMQVPHVWPDQYEPFYHTSEDLEGALAAYYDVPSLSLRNALYPLAVQFPTDGFLWNQTYNGNHPGDSGQKIMADLCVHLIQETARDLTLNPVTPEEEEDLARPLPEPMYSGNLQPPASTCVVEKGFKSMVKSSKGWGWVNEAKDDRTRGKWGYIATKAGSALVFQVNTRWRGVPAVKRLPLLIHYLKSYKGMGTARAECLSGCECEPLDIDAALKAYHSQTVMIAIHVSQHTNCTMQLTLLKNTTSNGTKFKVSGVTLIGSPDYHPDFFTVDFWSNPDV